MVDRCQTNELQECRSAQYLAIAQSNSRDIVEADNANNEFRHNCKRTDTEEQTKENTDGR